MEFRILGPVEAGEAGLGARQLRVVLASLAVNANRPVSMATLSEHLWGEEGTGTPTTVRSYIRRLRVTLNEAAPGQGGGEYIRRAGPGYVLDVARDQVDLLRFRALAEQAEAAGASGEPATCAALLDRALALWRGAPLADVVSDVLARDVVPALVDEQLLAVERWAEARLALGLHRETAGRLAGYAAGCPLREELQAQLMRALHGSGRRAEALALYQATRERLGEELGVGPGSGLERTYLAILRDEGATGTPRRATTLSAPATAHAPAGGPSPRPAELPADISGFTGRRAELERLRSSRAATVVISGAAGVGKTSLAVHAAHLLRDAFTDGQLFVDLRGHEADALSAGDVLRRFLRALGTDDRRIPADPDERAALYRSSLSGRRVLVVLDNAASAAQIRPLLPGSAGSLVLVTSRRRLDGLIAIDDAVPLSLDVLGHGDAVALLGRMIGADRVRGQRPAVEALAELCDRLPLALRIAAARLLAHPRRPVGWLVDELSNEQRRLARLTVEGDRAAAVPTAFSSAYDALDHGAARLFRLLGLHPGPDPAGDAVAALTGSTVASLQPAVNALLSAHLIRETATGAYAMHDLVHLYARQRAEAEEPEAERALAVARVLDHYLARTDAAGRPHQAYYRPPERHIEHPPTEPAPFTDPAGGLAWVAAEYANIRAAALCAARVGDHRRTWQLADALWFLQHRRRQHEDWIELQRLGLAAARELRDGVATRRMLRRLGGAYAETQRPAEAFQAYDEALTLARAAGDEVSEARVLNNLAVLYGFLGDSRRELDCFARCVTLARRVEIPEIEAMALSNMAETYTGLGRLDTAISHARQALHIHGTLPENSPRAVALRVLGRAQRLSGRHEEALASYREGLTVSEASGEDYRRAECLEGIGMTLASTRGPEQARPYLTRAEAIFRRMSHPRAQALRTELARLGEC
ncbi:AfsR/SARP family transcriptional regulator [Streptomyces sp. SBT349]|uniref:AfsR/SARP family transcriptional regulator n=1 Tax=Streptomyces sp. SBT349 TaxID=1580539 RepID=UPI00066E058F|nr:AfsR/SARP family transcriptional regulator [Streptomyces sp. SBT349]